MALLNFGTRESGRDQGRWAGEGRGELVMWDIPSVASGFSIGLAACA